MKIKIWIIIILIAMSIAAVGLLMKFVTDYRSSGKAIWKIALSIGHLAALILLIGTGSIMTTVYWPLSLSFLGLVLLGTLLKIMHLPFATVIIVSGLLGMGIIYFIRFLTKKSQNIVDILKLLWIIGSITGSSLLLSHITFPRIWIYFPEVLFWIMVISHIIILLRNDNLQEI